MVSAKEYRPWEIPRVQILCAGCGETIHKNETGLCAECEAQSIRGNQAWAPAFPSALSGGRKEPNPDASSYGSRPTIEGAGSARFYGVSRDTW